MYCAKRGESCAGQGTHKGVCSDGGGCEHQVGVHEVVQRLYEDGYESEAGEKTGEGGNYPVRFRGPSEPEQADCKSHPTNDLRVV